MRVKLTPEQRTADMRLTIDPGFVHHRLIQTVIRPGHIGALDSQIQAFPPDPPDHILRPRIDHLYMQALLVFCERLPAPTLGEILARQSGQLFCSTVDLAPAPGVNDRPRAISTIITPGVGQPLVELHYSTSHIAADTNALATGQGRYHRCRRQAPNV